MTMLPFGRCALPGLLVLAAFSPVAGAQEGVRTKASAKVPDRCVPWRVRSAGMLGILL